MATKYLCNSASNYYNEGKKPPNFVLSKKHLSLDGVSRFSIESKIGHYYERLKRASEWSLIAQVSLCDTCVVWLWAVQRRQKVFAVPEKYTT